ncbi:hypothetical protein DLJ49_17620 [Rhodovulum sp. 12E13]|uniref:hypothetical protein n=1 Tax=Rhodovulum sp. 12E13 TaxID=2203891 RepID=UPI000E1494CF|nr:hypothetical protein [Rhodovulum sp. 12E13]RDC69890.1 hypothetical protein DLJ49_17620 [Rhodovulum sp. 12E13]
MAARPQPFPHARETSLGGRDLTDRCLARDDLAEILREAGLPQGFAIDWLIDRVEPAARAPR